MGAESSGVETAIADKFCIREDFARPVEGATGDLKEIKFIDGVGGNLPETTERGVMEEDVIDDPTEFERGETGVNRFRETVDGFAGLREEPFDEAGARFQFTSDDGGAQSEGVRIVNLAK